MGRPRSFDARSALDAALAVFWAKGFESASLSELTEAMGIARPSLYAAYGDKEALFHAAMVRFDERYMGYFDAALAEPDLAHALDGIFSGFVELNASPLHPHGSPDTVGALVCSTAAQSVKAWLLDRRDRREMALAARFAQAIADAQWPARIIAADAAAYLMTLLGGMDVQAASGAPRERLERIAALARASLHVLSARPTPAAMAVSPDRAVTPAMP